MKTETFETEELVLPAAAAVASEAAASEVPPVEAEQIEEPTEEFCQISIWRGYAKSRFFARLEIGDNRYHEVAVAESPTFRPKGNGTPERTAAAEAAHAALLGFLLAEGWEVEGKADPWYADRLRRSVADRESASAPLPTT